MDIPDLKKSLRVGRLTGLYFWNFDVTHTKSYTFFTSSLIISILLTCMYLVGEEMDTFEKLLQIYSAVFNTADLITGVCFNIECATNAIRLPSNWTTLFHSLQRADVVIEPARHPNWNGARVSLYLSYVILTAIAFVACLEEVSPSWYILSFAFYCLIDIQKILYFKIMNRTILMLQRRYEGLRDSITITGLCSKEHYLVLYLLNEAIGAFNRIFGIGILIIFANALAVTINSFHYTLTLFTEQEVLQVVTEERCTMAFNLQSIVHLILTLMLIRSCDRVEAIHADILSTIDGLQARITDQLEAKKLLRFYVYCEGLPPRFTAAGFLRLNKDLFSSFFSALISYLILSVQLNATKEKGRQWKGGS